MIAGNGSSELDLQVDGARVHVHVWGEGPPVLMLHGNPDTGAMWAPVATRLAPRYRCFAPDLPGFGASELRDNFDISIPSQVRWVRGVADALGIDKPMFLAVHDIGGPPGLAFLCEHPERVRRVALANTLFFRSYRWHPWGRVWRTPILGEISVALMREPMFVMEMKRGSRKLSAEHIHEVYSRVKPETRRAVLRWYRALSPERFEGWDERLVALLRERIPAIVFWGEHDPYIGREYADRLGAREVHRFPDSGHWVIGEESEAVAARMSAFFAESS